MKWIVAVLACIGIAQAQVVTHNISDDSYAHVPLQFPFPLHGRVFTDSFMYSNGVVGFGSVNNHWCCNGFDLATARGYQFNYSILGLQTDLINYGQGRFQTEGTPQYQRYRWENISEYGVPNNLNTFGIEIRPSGSISMFYEKVNLSPWRTVTRGITGDTMAGEYNQLYYGAGYSSETLQYSTTTTVNLCLTDPLSSPSCPGYQQAYTAQQCTISALYSSVCPGYEQAYYNQQCTVNPLYDAGCSGYTEAYFNQQCSLNALYDRGCPGYAAAYALANIVTPPAVTVSAPTVQVSTTGTVSVETPVVSDPVVNEVITRTPNNTPNNTQSVSQSIQNTQNVNNQKQTETKEVKKEVKKVEPKNEVTASAPQIVAPVHEYKAPIILDLAYQQLVKKPIKDNNRAMYHLLMNSQLKHEEMVNEQYRK